MEISKGTYRRSSQNVIFQSTKIRDDEEGAQIRRSIKSVRSNIVEGYGRRKYKNDFLRFLIYAHASCNESLDHLEILYETNSLNNKQIYSDLHNKIDTLGAKLNSFIQTVQKSHMSIK